MLRGVAVSWWFWSQLEFWRNTRPFSRAYPRFTPLLGWNFGLKEVVGPGRRFSNSPAAGRLTRPRRLREHEPCGDRHKEWAVQRSFAVMPSNSYVSNWKCTALSARVLHWRFVEGRRKSEQHWRRIRGGRMAVRVFNSQNSGRLEEVYELTHRYE